MLRELVLKNRSYRRFHEDQAVDTATLRELVDLARLTPSAANRQPLKYMLSNTPERNDRIFPHLAWAGYLKDWSGPAPGERPAAYVVVLCDKEIAGDAGCDHGIAAQTMLLQAAEKGLGGCMIGAIDRDGLIASLAIPEKYEVLLVVALGVPREQVVLEDAADSIKYYRDDRDVHHVPKRPLDEVLLD